VTDVTDPGASESVVSWNDTAKVVDAALSTLTQHNITSVEGAVNGVIPSTGTYLGTIIDSAANPVTCATPNDFFNEGTGQIVVNWGDGTSDTLTGGADVPSQAGGLGMVVVQVADGTYGAADPSGNGCYFDVFGSHTYVEESEPNLPYRITVTIQDAGGSTTILHDTATVADSPLQAYTPAAQLTQCDLLSNQGDPCTGVIGGFQDPVVDNTGALSCESEANPVGSTPESIPFHYQVSINWGDGSPADTTTGQIAEVGGVPNGTCQFEVTGTHTYTTLGTFPVTITVTDEGHLVGSNDGAVLVTSSDSITSVVPAATAPLARPYGSAIVQYSYPNLNTPTYVLNLALYAYNNAVSGGVPPFNSPPPPWMTGHNNFYDRQAHLSIPGPVAGGIDPGAVDPRGCQNTFQPVYQCKLIPLSVVCSTAGSNGFAPFNTGKTETIWEKYQYTLPPHLGQPVLTRYARYDLQDYDPPIGGKIADNFQITMSSSTNPAVAAISNPPSPPDSHVFITC
jgi:hypothetical protein